MVRLVVMADGGDDVRDSFQFNGLPGPAFDQQDILPSPAKCQHDSSYAVNGDNGVNNVTTTGFLDQASLHRQATGMLEHLRRFLLPRRASQLTQTATV
jgi:hypothetical protein